MIIEYLRPEGMDEAVRMLSRTGLSSKPLGGGTVLSKKALLEDFAVVDLQRTGLDTVVTTGDLLEVGAACTLQQLAEHDQVSTALQAAIVRETNLHMRNMATVGGTAVSADGCSPVLTAYLALDATLVWQPGAKAIKLSDWLGSRNKSAPGVLIEKLVLSKAINLKCKFLARSPQDYPMASLAIAKHADGGMRITAGMVREGFPVVLYEGKSTADGIKAASTACNNLLSGSKYADYLKSVIPAMIKQMLQES